MKIKKPLLILAAMAGLSLAHASLDDTKTEAFFGAPKSFKSSKELRNDYPNIDDGSARAENKKILCPFHRLMERAGKYDSAPSVVAGEIIVSISMLVDAAEEFGCKVLGCQTVAAAVSTGQNSYFSDRAKDLAKFGKINVTRLHKARLIAHDCGLTFEKGGVELSDKRRDLSLGKLKALADANQPAGTLVLADIQKVKQEICDLEGVKSTTAGRFEMELIFNYLGGKDRGFIEYSDVERFLHAKMPLTKSIDGI